MPLEDIPSKKQTAIASALFAVLAVLFAFPIIRDIPVYGFIWLAVSILVTNRILSGKNTYLWRSAFFISIAAAFVIHFRLPQWKGIIPGEVTAPYCHIAFVSSIANYLRQQYIALTGGVWHNMGPVTLGFIWLGVTLAVGQAWCSWVCFYGGIDEAASKLLPSWLRPLKLSPPWFVRHLQALVLVSFITISFLSLTSSFCLWACPLKMTTLFTGAGNPDYATIRAIIMWATGLVFLFILPAITGKRTFCSFICPFGAWQALWGHLSPFRMKINHDKCVNCGKCVSTCPTLAIRSDSKSKPEISSYCNRCQACAGVCPANAISISAAGEEYPVFQNRLLPARTIFFITAMLTATIIGALFVPRALQDIANTLKAYINLGL